MRDFIFLQSHVLKSFTLFWYKFNTHLLNKIASIKEIGDGESPVKVLATQSYPALCGPMD